MRKARSERTPDGSEWSEWYALELTRFNQLLTQVRTYVRLSDPDEAEDHGRYDEALKQLEGAIRKIRKVWYSERLAEIDYEADDPSIVRGDASDETWLEWRESLKWYEDQKLKLAGYHNEASVAYRKIDKLTLVYRRGVGTVVGYFKVENEPLLEERRMQREDEKQRLIQSFGVGHNKDDLWDDNDAERNHHGGYGYYRN